jgi:hypothetical protein
MSNPFDYTNSITYTKKNLIRDTENPELAEKQYNAFLTNRGLSYFPDTIMYANDMNMRPELDGLLQYEYLLNSVRKSKRFSKWAKASKDEIVMQLAEYYGCSVQKAKDISTVLTTEQVDLILQKLQKGGNTK